MKLKKTPTKKELLETSAAELLRRKGFGYAQFIVYYELLRAIAKKTNQ